MVSLEKVSSSNKYRKINSSKIKNELLDFDKERLKIIINKHVKNTKSPVGKRIIKNWPDSLENFIKVVPNDFRRVLKSEQKITNTQKDLKKISGI
jgi:glutamate synthase domain-containing protein 3